MRQEYPDNDVVFDAYKAALLQCGPLSIEDLNSQFEQNISDVKERAVDEAAGRATLAYLAFRTKVVEVGMQARKSRGTITQEALMERWVEGAHQFADRIDTPLLDATAKDRDKHRLPGVDVFYCFLQWFKRDQDLTPKSYGASG